MRLIVPAFTKTNFFGPLAVEKHTLEIGVSPACSYSTTWFFGEELEQLLEVGRVTEDGVGGARFLDLGEKKDEVNDFFCFGSAIAIW